MVKILIYSNIVYFSYIIYVYFLLVSSKKINLRSPRHPSHLKEYQEHTEAS